MLTRVSVEILIYTFWEFGILITGNHLLKPSLIFVDDFEGSTRSCLLTFRINQLPISTTRW
jgi:hypothetical protein